MEKLLSKMGGKKKQIENIVIFIVLLIIVIIVINSLFTNEEENIQVVEAKENVTSVYPSDEMEVKLKNILSKISRSWFYRCYDFLFEYDRADSDV